MGDSLETLVHSTNSMSPAAGLVVAQIAAPQTVALVQMIVQMVVPAALLPLPAAVALKLPPHFAPQRLVSSMTAALAVQLVEQLRQLAVAVLRFPVPLRWLAQDCLVPNSPTLADLFLQPAAPHRQRLLPVWLPPAFAGPESVTSVEDLAAVREDHEQLQQLGLESSVELRFVKHHLAEDLACFLPDDRDLRSKVQLAAVDLLLTDQPTAGWPNQQLRKPKQAVHWLPENVPPLPAAAPLLLFPQMLLQSVWLCWWQQGHRQHLQISLEQISLHSEVLTAALPPADLVESAQHFETISLAVIRPERTDQQLMNSGSFPLEAAESVLQFPEAVLQLAQQYQRLAADQPDSVSCSENQPAVHCSTQLGRHP